MVVVRRVLQEETGVNILRFVSKKFEVYRL